jgi:hypothetical protein
VVEHCVDIAGVASSILATPTISFRKISDLAGPRGALGRVIFAKRNGPRRKFGAARTRDTREKLIS